MIYRSLFYPTRDLIPILERQADLLCDSARLFCEMQLTLDAETWKKNFSEMRNLEHRGDALLTEFREEISHISLGPGVRRELTTVSMAMALAQILPLTEDRTKSYYIGGYSLAGLFALWAASQTDRFQGVAAASPSVWFPGIVEHLREHPVRAEAVYLSLGDKEEKTRNKVMARVGDSIREIHQILQEQGIRSTLEWNPGNHFRDPDRRTAKAFAWVLPAQGGKGKY